MKDKIIIDSVDVSRCCALDKGKYCNGMYHCEGEICDFKFNCLLKKLKQKKQECKKEKQLKEMYHTYYKAKHSDVKDEFFKLKKELKRKEEECEELKTQTVTFLAIQPTDVEKQLFLKDKECNRYKQALEEIKEMLEVNIEQINIYPLKTNLEKILQKCEVSEDE